MPPRPEPEIALVYFDGCPHVEAARAALARALAASGASARWREWRTDDPALPVYARDYGSPSIFVGGREVTGAPPQGSAACRLYVTGSSGLAGAPGVEALAAAIHGANR